MPEVTHVGYSDESHWNQGQYRTIGLFSSEAGPARDLETATSKVLASKDIKELAWKGLRTDNTISVAEELCGLVVDRVCSGDMRIDVLIWDIADSRHAIRRRDDTANLARMYYHLITNVRDRKWPAGLLWQIHVDQRTDMDWQDLENYLQHRSRRKRTTSQLLMHREFATTQSGVSLKSVKSIENPLVQIADLFAGLAAFSWNQHREYEQWKLKEPGQLGFDFLDDTPQLQLSSGERYKNRALRYLDDTARKMHIRIRDSFSSGLQTNDPISPISFWLYRPQRKEDKAPQRNTK